MSEVSVVILNFNGKSHLRTFLPSVIEFSNPYDVIVVDNGSTDDSLEFINEHYPSLRVIELDQNYGYAGGYNKALAEIESAYYILLNSDIEVTENWIDPMLALAKSDTRIGAIQPKVLSYSNRDHFEYAGAAGGFIDWLGYPFCRGRIFGEMEQDLGQYDDTVEIFWATGACLFIRASDFKDSGTLDQDFFAHMEEIDLCWRLKNMGKKVFYTGESTVYHLGGGTLSKSNPRKTYLNFRNGLEMLFKNIELNKLLIIFPIRILLDLIAMAKFTFADSPANGFAVLKAMLSFAFRIRKTIAKRAAVSNHYRMAGCYRKSIVVARFVWNKKKFSQLMKLS